MSLRVHRFTLWLCSTCEPVLRPFSCGIIPLALEHPRASHQNESSEMPCKPFLRAFSCEHIHGNSFLPHAHRPLVFAALAVPHGSGKPWMFLCCSICCGRCSDICAVFVGRVHAALFLPVVLPAVVFARIVHASRRVFCGLRGSLLPSGGFPRTVPVSVVARRCEKTAETGIRHPSLLREENIASVFPVTLNSRMNDGTPQSASLEIRKSRFFVRVPYDLPAPPVSRPSHASRYTAPYGWPKWASNLLN